MITISAWLYTAAEEGGTGGTKHCKSSDKPTVSIPGTAIRGSHRSATPEERLGEPKWEE